MILSLGVIFSQYSLSMAEVVMIDDYDTIYSSSLMNGGDCLSNGSWCSYFGVVGEELSVVSSEIKDPLGVRRYHSKFNNPSWTHDRVMEFIVELKDQNTGVVSEFTVLTRREGWGKTDSGVSGRVWFYTNAATSYYKDIPQSGDAQFEFYIPRPAMMPQAGTYKGNAIMKTWETWPSEDSNPNIGNPGPSILVRFEMVIPLSFNFEAMLTHLQLKPESSKLETFATNSYIKHTSNAPVPVDYNVTLACNSPSSDDGNGNCQLENTDTKSHWAYEVYINNEKIITNATNTTALQQLPSNYSIPLNIIAKSPPDSGQYEGQMTLNFDAVW